MATSCQSTRILTPDWCAPIYNLWMLDPDARTREAFERRPEGWWLLRTLEGYVEVRIPPCKAVGFPLTSLWPDDEEAAHDH